MHKLLLVFLFAGHLALGQTGSRIKVPGTKCSLVPPDGFILAKEFQGFWSAGTGASIVISELPVGYVITASTRYTEAALKARGKTFISRERLDFNNSNGILIKVKDTVDYTPVIEHIFIFGNDKETVIVFGNYPEEFKSLEEKITQAQLSTVYEKFKEPEILEAVGYTVNVDGSGFKASGYSGGSLIYIKDRKVSSDTSILLVVSSGVKVAGPDRKLYAQEILEKFDGFDKIKEIREINIDNLKGYEFIAETETKALLYFVSLFKHNGEYYFILGTGNNSNSNLETYRKIAKTFKRKQPHD